MLEGKLVRLRALESTDLERAYTWINDREVTHYLAARFPLSLADERRWLEEGPTNSSAGGVRLAIETKEGVHIGNCDLHRVHAEDRKAGLGIMIGEKEYWGRGFGTDTMLTLLRFAFEQMNLHKVALGVFEFNERGLAMYAKLGFVEEGRFRDNLFQDGRYWDLVRMSILRREYEAAHDAIGTAAVPATT